MVVLSTLVTSITFSIGLIEKILTTYDWARKVLSKKWEKELEKYFKYLRVVKKIVRPYRKSNCSETSITGAAELVDGEIKDSTSDIEKWMKANGVYKKVKSDDFIKELKSSKTNIAQNLQLFSTAVQTRRYEKTKEGNSAVPQKRNHGMPQKRKAGNHAVPQKRNHGMPQTRKEGNPAMPQKRNHGMPQTKVKKRNRAMPQKRKESN